MSGLVILQWIGRVLLILLVILLVLILLVLLVPVRYRGAFSVSDPEPHEAPEWERVLHSLQGSLCASWMGPLLRLTIDWQDELRMDLQILFLHKDPRTLIPSRQADDKEQTPSGDRPQPSPGERIRTLYRKVDYYKRVLQKEESGYTLDKGKRILFRTLRRVLPHRWQLVGDVGLGDPAATAKVLEVQGMLYPLLAGHVNIRPEFMQYQMNGEGYCKGRIRLVHLVIAALQMAADRKVIKTVRRIRNANRNIEAHYQRGAVNGG